MPVNGGKKGLAKGKQNRPWISSCLFFAIEFLLLAILSSCCWVKAPNSSSIFLYLVLFSVTFCKFLCEDWVESAIKFNCIEKFEDIALWVIEQLLNRGIYIYLTTFLFQPVPSHLYELLSVHYIRIIDFAWEIKRYFYL